MSIDYQMNKYSREKSKFNGEPLFSTNEYSVNHLAKRLGVHPQHVYYLLRRGVLKADKRGSAWIISDEEIERIAKEKG
jgi:excisionase family DNA binding protein